MANLNSVLSARWDPWDKDPYQDKINDTSFDAFLSNFSDLSLLQTHQDGERLFFVSLDSEGVTPKVAMLSRTLYDRYFVIAFMHGDWRTAAQRVNRRTCQYLIPHMEKEWGNLRNEILSWVK